MFIDATKKLLDICLPCDGDVEEIPAAAGKRVKPFAKSKHKSKSTLRREIAELGRDGTLKPQVIMYKDSTQLREPPEF